MCLLDYKFNVYCFVISLWLPLFENGRLTSICFGFDMSCTFVGTPFFFEVHVIH